MTLTSQKLPWHMGDRKRRRQGKEKGVTNDRKGMLITENFKKVHSGDGYSVLWEKHHKSVYFKGCVSGHMCEKGPRNMV